MPAAQIFDEMTAADGAVRAHYARYSRWLAALPADRVREKLAEADTLFRRAGITFAVYGDEIGTERLIPFDIVPRIIPVAEWNLIERGLWQRVTALNAFLHDVYHDQQILRAGKIPPEQVLCNAQYRPEMQGIDVPMDVYAQIAGIDLVRAGAGEYYVLEDNLRAFGCVLHARGSQGYDAPVSGGVCGASGSAGRTLPGSSARHFA